MTSVTPVTPVTQLSVHLLVGALAVLGAVGFVAASAQHRLPRGPALLAVVWGLGAASWPLADTAARTDGFDVTLWVATVLLCILAVGHSSRTRDRQTLTAADFQAGRARPGRSGTPGPTDPGDLGDRR